MLSAEVAQERLKKVEQDAKEVALVRQERIKALPSPLRPIAFVFIGRDSDGKPLRSVRKGKERVSPYERAKQEELARLDTLSEGDRAAVFGSLYPKMGHLLGKVWRAEGMPYQTGWQRKAFRMTGHPEQTREARLSWYRSFEVQFWQYSDQDAPWLAQWTPYTGYGADISARLLAAAIDAGGAEGDEVFDILLASGRGDHEIGAMGRHVTRGLLTASRPDGWEFVEKMLLAAQRQEGLRQAILEAIDEAHPEAFRRMLTLIREHDLMRFSATVRAVDVWLGVGWDADNGISVKQANAALALIETFLADPAARDAAVATSDDGQTVYLALWSAAFEDAYTALPLAAGLLSDALPVRRYVGAHLLTQLNLPEAEEALLPALDDPDLRVATKAFQSLNLSKYARPHRSYASHVPGFFPNDGEDTEEEEDEEDLPEEEPLSPGDLFERIERNISRFPASRELEPLVWPWDKLTADQSALASVLTSVLGERSPNRLFPYLTLMNASGRAAVARLLGEADMPNTPEVRSALLTLASDMSEYVRTRAFEALNTCRLEEEAEIVRVEALLKRKSGDLRRAVLGLLLKGDDPNVLGSAERLVTAKDAQQRVAGLDLLGRLMAEKRSVNEARLVARRFEERRGESVSEAEKTLLKTLLDEAHEVPTLANALGLMDPEQLTRGTLHQSNEGSAPSAGSGGLLSRLTHGIFGGREAGPQLVTKATSRITQALDDLIWQHRETPVPLRNYLGDTEEVLLENAGYRFPDPDYTLPLEEDLSRLPLREVWEGFLTKHADELKDGQELLRVRSTLQYCTERGGASQYMTEIFPDWMAQVEHQLFVDSPELTLKLPYLGISVAAWLIRREEARQEPASMVDFLLDATETTLTLIPTEALAGYDVVRTYTHSKETSRLPHDWRDTSRLLIWVNAARLHRTAHPESWSDAQISRLWDLVRWMDFCHPGGVRQRPPMPEIAEAFRFGAANEHDVYDALLGPRESEGGYWRSNFRDLRDLSGRKGHKLFERVPALRDIVQRCRERVIEVELRRGDSETAASNAAQSVRYAGGAQTLAKLLAAMGKENFIRGYSSGYNNRSSVFSHLIRATFPGEEDTPAAFAEWMKAAGIPEKRLIEVAVYAPQWARQVEHTLGWPHFSEAVWWFHAHTKGDDWTVDQEIREAWAGEISDKTPLTAQDLVEGAVDVAWFHRVYTALGPDRWDRVEDAAKYASSSGGHKRAQLFAGAMLGRQDRSELLGRIKDKRNQDALRALGLLPLATGATERDTDLLERYKVIQEFLRTSRQFGAQRQESEKKAARIGLENLARTAGYADPNRLTWAMEAQAVADLKGGAITATVGEVEVSLSINPLGLPDLFVSRKGKALKSIPPAVKKDPAVAELVARRTEIERQASRMRLSLESAMCRGDVFRGAELASLLEHPVLAPMLRSLVFLAEDGDAIGYPIEAGRALETAGGDSRSVSVEMPLRLAHPYDLLRTGEWDRWQRDCFLRERLQPFKQVFRELYVLTEQEREDGTLSRRYAGHQVNPKQALALLGKRGWVSHPEEGVRRTFHEEGVTVTVDFMGLTFSPADVEGLTVEEVRFTKKGEYRPLPLAEINPRVFSEAMRDLDLVVSVAHQGGVDPEASASTVEMRAALIRETAGLLKLDNLRFEKSHVLIDGALAKYSVHLGSAIVHRQPGGYVCIVPVHSQHRGRLFLPFADDDPRTAEVLSKVLLLARDKEIKDPTILEQILAVR